MEIRKVYYTTPEISERIGVEENTIRKWCKYFDLKILRDGRNRKFTIGDERELRLIKFLQDEGRTMAGIKQAILNKKFDNDKRYFYKTLIK